MEEKVRIHHRTRNFFEEVRAETKKVTWPTRGELYGATAVVISVTIMLSITLGIVDLIIGYIMQFLLLF
jgi:preprotein translocase subunit SecE